MKLSIIIPALNEAACIERAIARAWALQPAEVIVVDGQSEDGTVGLAQTGGATVIQAERGRGTQQNAGAKLATGDALLFLHADTWLPPAAAAQIAAAAERYGDALCGAFQQRIDATGFVYRLIERGNAWRARWLRTPYGDQGLFFARELFEKCGGFPAVPLMEDLQIMRRVRKHARPILLPGPICVSARRWQQHGPVRQTLGNWRLLLAERRGVPEENLQRRYDGG